jgi:hypothetical protein
MRKIQFAASRQCGSQCGDLRQKDRARPHGQRGKHVNVALVREHRAPAQHREDADCQHGRRDQEVLDAPGEQQARLRVPSRVE